MMDAPTPDTGAQGQSASSATRPQQGILYTPVYAQVYGRYGSAPPQSSPSIFEEQFEEQFE